MEKKKFVTKKLLTNRGAENLFSRDASPLDSAIYGLTLSSNYALKSNARSTYRYIISQFPEGNFDFIYSKSEKRKHHVHGIMIFKYNFNFQYLMSSRNTVDGRRFDVNIHYDLLPTGNDYWNWFDYCNGQKTATSWHSITLGDPALRKFQRIPHTCIPEITPVTKVRSIRIKGIY